MIYGVDYETRGQRKLFPGEVRYTCADCGGEKGDCGERCAGADPDRCEARLCRNCIEGASEVPAKCGECLNVTCHQHLKDGLCEICRGAK